jgi:hypothetical protein
VGSLHVAGLWRRSRDRRRQPDVALSDDSPPGGFRALAGFPGTGGRAAVGVIAMAALRRSAYAASLAGGRG